MRVLVTMLVLICATISTSFAKVDMIRGENKIDVMSDGKLVTSFLFKPNMTKPVLYPLMTPSGVFLSRHFPFEKVEGETKDHPHHIGLFFTYDKVNKDGFWNNTATPPQIKLAGIKEVEGGKQGEIDAELHWVAKSGKTLLKEERSMVFSPGKNYYSITFEIKLTAQDTTVVFSDTKEGMFAIRVADWLAEKNGKSEYLSSNGDKKEKDIWGKRATWVRLEGSKDDKTVGIAIFNHPKSTNYPTYWHARAYGLFAANPLGQEDFQKGRKEANPQPLNLKLEPGKSALFKFQVIVYDGAMSKAELDKLFAKYTK